MYTHITFEFMVDKPEHGAPHPKIENPGYAVDYTSAITLTLYFDLCIYCVDHLFLNEW